MKIKYHKNLTINRWRQLSLAQQLANIGAEVKRAIFWQEKDKLDLSQSALFRALELFDLTLASYSQNYPTLKEIARAREVIVDFFSENRYQSTAESLNRYFYQFNYLANKQRKR